MRGNLHVLLGMMNEPLYLFCSRISFWLLKKGDARYSQRGPWRGPFCPRLHSARVPPHSSSPHLSSPPFSSPLISSPYLASSGIASHRASCVTTFDIKYSSLSYDLNNAGTSSRREYLAQNRALYFWPCLVAIRCRARARARGNAGEFVTKFAITAFTMVLFHQSSTTSRSRSSSRSGIESITDG